MGKKRALVVSNPPVPSSSEEEDSDASEVEKQTEPQKSKAGPESGKPLKSKPAPESSEETEEGSSEEETDDEEEEKSKPVAATAETTTIPDPALPEESSESEADDESGSDEDSLVDTKSPSASAFTIKPASKPISDSKQQEPKSTPAKVAGKRASETQLNVKDSKVKKSKVSNKEEEVEDPKSEEKKSGGNSRLWTEKDEIALLNGLIRYKSEKGPDPDLSLFPEFLKGSIRADFSKVQLLDKMRRLKKKYLTYLEKNGNGEDPIFQKLHESVLFDLSKKIWNSAGKFTSTGDENGVINNTTPIPKKSKKTEIKKGVPKEDIKTVVAADEPKAKPINEEEKVRDFVFQGLDEMFKFPNMSAEESKKYFEKNLGLIGSSKAKEMNDKWKELQIEEFEVYSKKLALMSEMSKLMLDAFKSSKN